MVSKILTADHWDENQGQRTRKHRLKNVCLENPNKKQNKDLPRSEKQTTIMEMKQQREKRNNRDKDRQNGIEEEGGFLAGVGFPLEQQITSVSTNNTHRLSL